MDAVRASRVAAALTVAGTIIGFGAWLLPIDGSFTTPHTAPGVEAKSPRSDQKAFIDELEKSRKGLIPAFASVRLTTLPTVNRAFPVDLAICAGLEEDSFFNWPSPEVSPKMSMAERASHGLLQFSAECENPQWDVRGLDGDTWPAETSITSSNTPLGPLMVGGRVRADLNSYDSRLEVSPGGSDEQTLASESDRGGWRWNVVAAEGGEFPLRVSITVLKGDTEIALLPTRVFDLKVKVKGTAADSAKETGKHFWAAIGGSAGIAALLTVLIGALTLRRRSRGRGPQDGAVGETPDGSALPPRSAPKLRVPSSGKDEKEKVRMPKSDPSKTPTSSRRSGRKPGRG